MLVCVYIKQIDRLVGREIERYIQAHTDGLILFVMFLDFRVLPTGMYASEQLCTYVHT